MTPPLGIKGLPCTPFIRRLTWVPGILHQFVFQGQPVAWARARVFGKRFFTAPKVQAAKHALQIQMRNAFKKPYSGPLKVSLQFIFKKAVRTKEDLHHYPAKKPDTDNLIKLVLDSGNLILWKDDAQIVSLSAHKRYGEVEQTILTMETLL